MGHARWTEACVSCVACRRSRSPGNDSQVAHGRAAADEIAKNFDQTREQLLNTQREQIFRVFLGTISEKYQQGGGIRLTKQAAAPGGIPAGS